MPGNIRLWGTTGYVELAAPSTATNQVLTLPTDSIQPAMILLNTTAFSGASSVSVNNVFTSAYENYRVVISLTSSGANILLRMRLRANGVDNSSAVYNSAGSGLTVSGSSDPSNAANATSFSTTLFNSLNAQDGMGWFDIMRPQLALRTVLVGQVFASIFTGGFAHRTVGGIYADTQQFDGFTFFPESSTISGNLYVYGYKKS